ncbi:MAG TPA: PHP domain-containing protein [Smithella sp.]|jgi:PHP family Zn ribbon phosphoesterase|nr:PHP domain-containing protein [Smithella sp.]HNQ65099.1 PHP domain-containing protein [Smithella sp.]HOG10818.1 PHP domain-containing protein [Smithella sp.]HOO34671.1 PHP domain-containing protein [Smithella sp.]HOS15009.1 PHP domain-containing protein [Smithella sp.]
MMKVFNCDLHIHTCLSPCAELDMHPAALVEKTIDAGLDVIAVCDHNASENVPYVIKAAQGTHLKILPGMEITTSEEVHFLALFDSLSDLIALQHFVDLHLPGKNDEDRFGVQAIVNEHGEVEGLSDKLLIGATDVALNDLLTVVHHYHGLAIASHIDRESFSVLGQLGFIDDSIHFDALEISYATGIRQARERYADLKKYAFITSSDAHYLKDIGRATTKIMINEPTLSELKMAFSRENGRYVVE